MRLIFVYGREKELSAGPLDRPMSGIRTAALGLCHALARRGHEVHLVARCPNPGVYESVAFHDRADLAALADESPADVLIVIPEVLPLLMPLQVRARVIWTGNAFPGGDVALSVPWRPQEEVEPVERRLGPLTLLRSVVDRIVVGSEWHAQRLREQVPLRDGMIRVSYLGVPLEHYRGPEQPRNCHRLIYTSQARRGLDLLLAMFPRIRSAVPTAELRIFGYEYSAEPAPEGWASHPMPGVHWMGRASKSALARELRSAGMLAYPTRFRETFSLSVAEAQAAGLPVVTSDLAALSERVHNGVDGFLIPGNARKPRYADAFVECVVRLLVDHDLWARCSAAAYRFAHVAYDWDVIAAGWEADLEGLMARREASRPDPKVPADLFHLVSRPPIESGDLPPEIAIEALCATWSSYGFDRALLDKRTPVSRAYAAGRIP